MPSRYSVPQWRCRRLAMASLFLPGLTGTTGCESRPTPAPIAAQPAYAPANDTTETSQPSPDAKDDSQPEPAALDDIAATPKDPGADDVQPAASPDKPQEQLAQNDADAAKAAGDAPPEDDGNP